MSPRPLRIAQVVWRIGTRGGVETVVRQVATNVDPQAVETHLVTARPRLPDDRIDELPVVQHPGTIALADGLGAMVRLRCSWTTTVALLRIRPDCVHVHSGTAWMGFLASVLMPRTPFLLEVHDAPGSGRHDRWTDALEWWWVRLRRVTVLCHSSSVEEEIRRHADLPARRLVRFPLAAELSDVDVREGAASVRSRHGLGPEAFVVIAVGRLVPTKRLDRAIDAIAALTDVDAVLLVVGPGIAGPGEERDALEQHAASMGVGDRVMFLGAVDDDDLVAVLRAADVLVSTSSYEGFGLSIVEAMGAGLPVVATAVGGVTELVVDGETGFLVDDVPELVDRLRQLANDRALAARMGAAGRARAEAEFSAPVMASRVTELYRRIAGALSDRRSG
ncbi:MAG: glycosyltransferase family 4 protein [Acidimicrobiales bacterium]